MKAEPQVQHLPSHGRTLPAALAVAALLLAHTAAPPPARADHRPPTAEPDAYCGFTGVQQIELCPGEELPLPKRYENLTTLTWNFYIYEFGWASFLPAEYMTTILRGPLTLSPGRARIFRTFGFRLPIGAPPGTYFVDQVVKANYVGPGISRTLDVARCQYNLRVLSNAECEGTPLPAGDQGAHHPPADH